MAMQENATSQTNTAAHDIFIKGLRNAHALEKQALQIMERQVERLENYPEMEAALRRHIAETEQQRVRLEEVLGAYDASTSGLKESVLGFVGNVMAMGHTPAQDEVLKNTFANQAFENYEIATYKSLIAMAEAAGHTDVTPFEQTLREEERMAEEVRGMVEDVTRKYIALTSSGAKASR